MNGSEALMMDLRMMLGIPGYYLLYTGAVVNSTTSNSPSPTRYYCSILHNIITYWPLISKIGLQLPHRLELTSASSVDFKVCSRVSSPIQTPNP